MLEIRSVFGSLSSLGPFQFLAIITDVIPDKLKEIIEYAADYIGDSTDDWFRVKKELVNLFPPKQRSKFSRRHYSTKLHSINEFEMAVMNYWKNATGVELQVDENRLHDPNWEQKPRGWGLRKFNDERRRQAEATDTN